MVKLDLDWGQSLKKLNKLAEAKGVEAPETQALLRNVVLAARFDVALLLLIVANMTAKPFS